MICLSAKRHSRFPVIVRGLGTLHLYVKIKGNSNDVLDGDFDLDFQIATIIAGF